MFRETEVAGLDASLNIDFGGRRPPFRLADKASEQAGGGIMSPAGSPGDAFSSLIFMPSCLSLSTKVGKWLKKGVLNIFFFLLEKTPASIVSWREGGIR